MSEKKETPVERAVREIEYDLTDRRGLSGEWDQIDDDIKAEIRAAWAGIVKRAIDRAARSTQAGDGESKE